MTSLRRFPLRAGLATVVRREPLTPRMLRITLKSSDFGADWPLQQPGEIITLCFATPEDDVVLPEEGWRFPAGAPEQPWRNYTVRSHRPQTGEIDVDVLLHEPRGPACTVASQCQLGWSVGYAGPRVDYAPIQDVDWLLLVGDETALPAIAAILEVTSPSTPALALIEVGGPEDELTLQPHHRVQWVHRGRAPAGVSTALCDALRALELPDGTGQAWGAAESTVARELRTVLRDERGMPRTHARARGYWLRTGDWLDDEE